jgi:hypothetical protein
MSYKNLMPLQCSIWSRFRIDVVSTLLAPADEESEY